MKTEKIGVAVSLIAITVIAGFASFTILSDINNNKSLSVSDVSSSMGVIAGYKNKNVLGANTEEQQGIVSATKEYYSNLQNGDNYLTDTPISGN